MSNLETDVRLISSLAENPWNALVNATNWRCWEIGSSLARHRCTLQTVATWLHRSLRCRTFAPDKSASFAGHVVTENGKSYFHAAYINSLYASLFLLRWTLKSDTDLVFHLTFMIQIFLYCDWNRSLERSRRNKLNQCLMAIANFFDWRLHGGSHPQLRKQKS